LAYFHQVFLFIATPQCSPVHKKIIIMCGRLTKVKLAIVAAGLTNWEVATLANGLLGPPDQLSELDISKIVTRRKTPTATQKVALARVLKRTAAKLFAGVGR
jgi:hypothetical protein